MWCVWCVVSCLSMWCVCVCGVVRPVFVRLYVCLCVLCVSCRCVCVLFRVYLGICLREVCVFVCVCVVV